MTKINEMQLIENQETKQIENDVVSQDQQNEIIVDNDLKEGQEKEHIEKEENFQESSWKNSEQWQENVVKDIESLSFLLNVDAKGLVEEFYITQIQKIMSRLQKVVVRYDVSELELENTFVDASYYGLGGFMVAPAYLPLSVKISNKVKNNACIYSLIDFPFGESSFKGKISDIKESFKTGCNMVAVALPSMLLNKENLKELKKQCKKICMASKKRAGIVLNAIDIKKENFEQALKVIGKTKVSFITLAFGDATIEDVKQSLSIINACQTEKKIFVLANIESVESAVELYKNKVDKILTPYADKIGLDLLKRYNLN